MDNLEELHVNLQFKFKYMYKGVDPERMLFTCFRVGDLWTGICEG